MSMFKWNVVDPAPGEPVAPHQRLGWGKTTGLGAQHVIAMFGATFVFPIIMGLNPNLAIMMSGIATICFLLIVKGKGAELPRHVGVLRRWRQRHLRPERATGRRHRVGRLQISMRLQGRRQPDLLARGDAFPPDPRGNSGR